MRPVVREDLWECPYSTDGRFSKTQPDRRIGVVKKADSERAKKRKE